MKRRLRWFCRTVNAIDALPVYGQVMKRNARLQPRPPGTAWSTGRPGRKKDSALLRTKNGQWPAGCVPNVAVGVAAPGTSRALLFRPRAMPDFIHSRPRTFV